MQHLREQRRKRVSSRLHRYSDSKTFTFSSFPSNEHSHHVLTTAVFARALGLASVSLKSAWGGVVDRLQDTASMFLQAFGEPPRYEEFTRIYCCALGVTVLCLLASCYYFCSAFAASSEQEFLTDGVSAVAVDMPSALQNAAPAQAAKLTTLQSAMGPASSQSATVVAAVGFAASVGLDQDAGLSQQPRVRLRRVDRRLPAKVRMLLLIGISAGGGFMMNALDSLRVVLPMCM